MICGFSPNEISVSVLNTPRRAIGTHLEWTWRYDILLAQQRTSGGDSISDIQMRGVLTGWWAKAHPTSEVQTEQPGWVGLSPPSGAQVKRRLTGWWAKAHPTGHPPTNCPMSTSSSCSGWRYASPYRRKTPEVRKILKRSGQMWPSSRNELMIFTAELSFLGGL